MAEQKDGQENPMNVEEGGIKPSVAELAADRLKTQPSMMSRGSTKSRSRKRREARKRGNCEGRERWDCEEEPHWRIYMQMFADDAKRREEADRERYGAFYRKKPPKDAPSRWPGICLTTGPICQALNVLNTSKRHDDPSPESKMWDGLREPKLLWDSASESSCSAPEWPKLFPCSRRDVVRERKILARKAKMRKLGALPCKIDAVDSPESSDEEELVEMANLKELGHAVIPRTLPKKRNVILVDRACGESPGLVEGDYVVFELVSKKATRSYTNICLRGTTGMHLGELERVRERTWKFCLFQALVALLTKTQFRYKYVWSANIDYMYEHAWMLFLHVGLLNVVKSQRFDDVLVYNYKYSVEVELVDELGGVRVDPMVGFRYTERGGCKPKRRPRRELMLVKSSFGSEREKDQYKLPAHRSYRAVEKWFDKLEIQYTNCIYRTTRFSLAFWQDGPFWYLYNPYRCDKHGFWDDKGFACVVKFCTKASLKRHLMILTLRAYAYEAEVHGADDASDKCKNKKKSREEFAIQIFQVIYHSCQIHNVKLYNRKPKRPRLATLVEGKKSDPCTFDPLVQLAPKVCTGACDDDESSGNMEKPRWIQDSRITWSKNATDVAECKKGGEERPKWHAYDVLEPRRLYVLWSDVHVSDQSFAPENRNRQVETCHAVCAGMGLVRTAEYWTPDVLNAIVVSGDRFFTERKLKLQRLLDTKDIRCANWDVQPLDQFRVANMLFELKVHPVTRGRLFARGQGLWSTLERLFREHEFVSLSCQSSSFGIFKHCGAYYALDVLSYGPPVYGRGRGGTYLLRASCFGDLVKCLVLVVGTPECCEFELRPMEIVRVEELGVEESGVVREETECGEDYPSKPACPLEDERRKASKKRGPGGPEPQQKIIDIVVCKKTKS
ncbi:uncharacterized protein LOC106642819 [Copidosoma floridanum]|uniref:uncharacterized protein LOC106642819 n=1 Tax=Copidosoma floridanum TaxID=29053 RepID=UPI0006C96C60|nr:uncharacterized protein LOC106642819 [Copidosoma floridanum]